jgi:hypothetical protein
VSPGRFHGTRSVSPGRPYGTRRLSPDRLYATRDLLTPLNVREWVSFRLARQPGAIAITSHMATYHELAPGVKVNNLNYLAVMLNIC